MYLLDFEKLQNGDIVLTKSDSRISELVRKLTKSEYSHATLFVGFATIIDSDGYGVQANNIQRLLIDNEENVVVMRLKESVDEAALESIENFARMKIGTEYSTNEAKIATITKELEAKEPNRQFCTRFIAQAYESAGINLVKNPNYCVPEEILKSDKLVEVKDILRKASEIEIKFAKSENPAEKQREIFNSIFETVRELTGNDIQTFGQIDQVVIDKAEIDLELTEFIRESGYLSLMENDVEKNPWHYDASKMIEHYKSPNAIFSVATHFLNTEEKTRSRFERMLYNSLEYNRENPRAYFKMMIELYRKLIKYSRQREIESLKALKYL